MQREQAAKSRGERRETREKRAEGEKRGQRVRENTRGKVVRLFISVQSRGESWFFSFFFVCVLCVCVCVRGRNREGFNGEDGRSKAMD